MFASRKQAPQYMKNVDTDVEALKAMFREHIGSTWREATHRNTESELGLPAIGPWVQLAQSGREEHIPGGLFEWVEDKVRAQGRWMRWAA